MSSAPLRATYRLQLNRDFTFADATEIVEYLAALGVSHLYASPFLKARPGSTHGYDITDHNAINSEIGDEAALERLSARLAGHGMGLILDFVPNHTGVGGNDNAWWLDVLEWGEASPYAEYFDIDWAAGRRNGGDKILCPVLGEQYGIVLEKGEIDLRFDIAEGGFSAWYYAHRFPISPSHYAALLARVAEPSESLGRLAAAFRRLPEAACLREEGLGLKRELAALCGAEADVGPRLAAAAASLLGKQGERRTWRRLHALLEGQAYRLAYWRVAADEINYRRFFNINDLAGIRVELPHVFASLHRLVLRLAAEGRIAGLRIDHVDGLYDPAGYCRRLQEEAAAAAGVKAARFPIFVEKILAAYENLRDWPVAGTTGYDFIAQAGGVFVDGDGEAGLTRAYRRFTGREDPFDAVLLASKRRIADVNFASEMSVLAREFHALSRANWASRDFTLIGMRRALAEVIACFPVYRTYVGPDGASPEDRRYIAWAAGQARKRWPGTDISIFDFIEGVLTLDIARAGRGYDPNEVERLAMKFQQVSGPVMAKGAEDTAFYRYNRLLALNEVGGDPRRFGVSVAAFHHLMEQRWKSSPRSLLASSTHDTKRGEDARARLAVLSEIPQEWERRLARWSRLNRLRRGEVDGVPAPDRNDEYFFYQTALGAWPLDLDPADAAGVGAFAARIEATMIKMVREAKEQSSWSNPNLAYEALLSRFVQGALDASRPNAFLRDIFGFVERLARAGAINSLGQTLLKLAAPGAPDLYQGAELWDFSMVDPDNRRPVDFARRRRMVEELGSRPFDPAALRGHWRTGVEKLFLIARVLNFRAAEPALFAGDYLPLAVTGVRAQHLVAFARAADGGFAVAVAPRLQMPLLGEGEPIDWGDTAIALPEALSWRDVLAARDLVAASGSVAAAEILRDFPVALLCGARAP